MHIKFRVFWLVRAVVFSTLLLYISMIAHGTGGKRFIHTAPAPGGRRFLPKANGTGGKRFIHTDKAFRGWSCEPNNQLNVCTTSVTEEPGEYDYINPPSGWHRAPHGHRETTSDNGYLNPRPTMTAERVVEQPDGTKITTRIQAHGVNPIDVPTYTAMLSLTSGEMPATKDGYITMAGNEGAKDGYITMGRNEGTTMESNVDPVPQDPPAESGPIIEEVL